MTWAQNWMISSESHIPGYCKYTPLLINLLKCWFDALGMYSGLMGKLGYKSVRIIRFLRVISIQTNSFRLVAPHQWVWNFAYCIVRPFWSQFCWRFYAIRTPWQWTFKMENNYWNNNNDNHNIWTSSSLPHRHQGCSWSGFCRVYS